MGAEVLRRYDRLDPKAQALVHDIGRLVLDAAEFQFERGQSRMKARMISLARSRGVDAALVPLMQDVEFELL